MRRLMNEKRSEFDPRKFLAEARSAARELCMQRYEAFGASGQAHKISPVPLDQMAEAYERSGQGA